jgi:hypothetical protein
MGTIVEPMVERIVEPMVERTMKAILDHLFSTP